MKIHLFKVKNDAGYSRLIGATSFNEAMIAFIKENNRPIVQVTKVAENILNLRDYLK